jgi:uncharacterized protein (DUF1778 family)
MSRMAKQRLNRKRGKPGEKSLKKEEVRFRASPDEKKELQAAADKAELSLSAWLRQVGLRAARARTEPT